MDRGQYTSVSFIDLKKAFNTVDHQILLNKLKVYGLSVEKISCFEPYLRNRKQCCRVCVQTSNLQPIKIRSSTGVLLRSTAFLNLH